MTSDWYNITFRWHGHLCDFMTFNFLCSYGCFDIDISFYFSEKLLDIEPWMVGRYTNGSIPVQVTGLLEAAASRVLRQREALAVRDSLCLQLVLANAKRVGDITHIKEGYGKLMVSVQC